MSCLKDSIDPNNPPMIVGPDPVQIPRFVRTPLKAAIEGGFEKLLSPDKKPMDVSKKGGLVLVPKKME